MTELMFAHVDEKNEGFTKEGISRGGGWVLQLVCHDIPMSDLTALSFKIP